MSAYNVIIWILVIAVIGAVVFKTFFKGDLLKKGKMSQTGHGEFGTAAFAKKEELEKTFKKVEYRPDLWRQGECLPEYQGLVVHCEQKNDNVEDTILGKAISKFSPKSSQMYCYVDDGDVHTLLIGSPGIGKTAYFLYPNIEYACASGMSFFTTDTKGDLYTNMGTIAEKYYGYEVKIIDLRFPLQSSHYNMLYQLNYAMDKYKETGKSSWLGKAEKNAKIISKAIISAGIKSGSDMGSNQYFYDSAEGIITAILLILAEYGEKGERHIVSCFRLLRDMMAPSNEEGKNQLQIAIDLLPQDSRARSFAATALETAPETMQSVISTAMSKLLSFLDSEMEQILCFKNQIDVESFCTKKTAIFLVLPEEDRTKYFIASLFIQQIYNEMLPVAAKMGGKFKNRVMFYCDELGTMPKIEGMEEMFTAARSRGISIVAVIQEIAQFERNYGKESANIIMGSCQNILFGSFGPESESAERLSKSLGTQTVLNTSVTYNERTGLLDRNNAASRNESMTSRPLMTADEIKSLPKTHFILQKTNHNPFKTRLKLFLDWGITFEEKYEIPEGSEKRPKYADKNLIVKRIVISNPEFIKETAENPHRQTAKKAVTKKTISK